MVMSFKSPLGRIQMPHTPRGSRIEMPIPEFLHLPDGRKFNTQELLKQKTKPININLRSGRIISKNKQSRKPTLEELNYTKYPPKERIWQMTATVEELMLKYSLNEKQASGMRYTAK